MLLVAITVAALAIVLNCISAKMFIAITRDVLIANSLNLATPAKKHFAKSVSNVTSVYAV